jgi:hypothetical protein
MSSDNRNATEALSATTTTDDTLDTNCNSKFSKKLEEKVHKTEIQSSGTRDCKEEDDFALKAQEKAGRLHFASANSTVSSTRKVDGRLQCNGVTGKIDLKSRCRVSQQ